MKKVNVNNGSKRNLEEYKNVRMTYGCIDATKIKSIYVDMILFVQPKVEFDYDRYFNYLRRQILYDITKFNHTHFNSKGLVNIDVKTDSMTTDKRSSLVINIFLYTKHVFNFKKNLEIKNDVTKFMHHIIDRIVEDQRFDYSNTRK